MAVKWTPEQKAKACEEILKRVAGGMSLESACKGDDWIPARTTFQEWCEKDDALAVKYARAREDRAEKIFEEILTIADSQEGDVIEVDGVEMTNHDQIARAKLRIDARKWMLGKMQPRVYGEKLDVNHAGGLTITLDSDSDKL